MKPSFDNKPDIFRLDEIPGGFLQVCLPSFTLTKEGCGRLIDIEIGDDLYAICDGAGKRQFFESVQGTGEAALRRQCDQLAWFEREERVLSYRFDCQDRPLRYGNGGVLPIVHLTPARGGKGEDYFCLFYRDLFPIGWNIANGASDNVQEMMDPERILLREFGEELLTLSKDEKLIYTFDPGRENAPVGYQSKALKAWAKQWPDFPLDRCKTLSIPMKWVPGPDRIRVRTRSHAHTSGGYFLNITPEDSAIEADRIALINLKGNVTFFDGEHTRGVILNRVVGLFKVSEMRGRLRSHTFLPDILFFNGKKASPARLRDRVKRYLGNLNPPHRSEEDREKWNRAKWKFDLCPITRAMIDRYFHWAEAERANEKARISENERRMTTDPGACQVFISYRSPDAEVAKLLFAYLSSHRYKVFCSAESLPRLGESDYATAIYRALEMASCQVVVGTKAEYFDSGWVGFEWRSFLNEINSERKKGGDIFTFASGVHVDDLPFALRSCQMIPFALSSPRDSMESLHQFIRQSLSRSRKA
ncbi:MAG: toll/interleukin-1 receptor domain-containing protein [Candidatus Eisenbacteria bacterium]